MKKLIILLLLVVSSKNNFSQDSTSIFVYEKEGFSITLPKDYKLEKSNESNVSNIRTENGSIFAFIYLLHLSDFVQKRELELVTNYDSLAKKEIIETMNSTKVRTVESEVDYILDSLKEYKTQNGFICHLAFHREESIDYPDKSEVYFVQPNYFLVIPQKKDRIILLFEYLDDEMNKRKFNLNENNQHLMLNIIDSVQLIEK